MRAKELVIQLLHSKTNIVVLVLLIIGGIVAAVPFLRHRVKKIYTRKVMGSFAWVLVRLGIAIPATILLVHYESYFSDRFQWFRSYIGKDFLAFLAITFAIVQFLDARAEEKGMGEIEDRIQHALDNASTRAIGSFPVNLRKIIEMLNGAKSSIRIIVDFPGYGMYSDPDLYADYLQALKAGACNSNVEFQMVSYDKTLTIEDTKREFPTLPDSKEKKFARFFNGVPSEKIPKNIPDLADCLQNRQAESMASLESTVKHKSGLQRRYLSVRAPLFLWLIDDREVIFTFKDLENNSETYSIRSSDDNLVRHFIGYFKQEFAHSGAKYEPEPTYILRNVTPPLVDGGVVTLTGRYTAQDRAVIVTKIDSAPVVAK